MNKKDMVNPDYLLEMYKEIKNDMREYSNREWETVKFFTYIFVALTTVYFTLISIIGFSNILKIIMISVIIPPSIIIFSILGWRNFKRECARLFECIATVKKIEEKIGFCDKRDNNRKVLKCDEYYLSDEMVMLDPKIKTTEQFINGLIEKNTLTRDYGNSYSGFKWIFFVYCCISIAMTSIVLILSLKIV